MAVEVEYGPIGSVRRFIREKTMSDETKGARRPKDITVTIHPLMELLAKDLFSIETVPPKEMGRMVARACRDAAKWHDAEIERLKKRVAELEKALRHEQSERAEDLRDAIGEMRDVAAEEYWRGQAEAEGYPPGCY